MRALAPLVLFTALASTTAPAQTAPDSHSPLRFRFGAFVGSALADLKGGHGRVTTSLSAEWGYGVGMAVEFAQPQYAFELGTTWLDLEYTEDLAESDTVPWRASYSGSLTFLHLHGSMLLHRSFRSGHDLLAGVLLGTVFVPSAGTSTYSSTEVFSGGLTYGVQAVLGFPLKSRSHALTAGLQYVVLPTADEYDAESLQLLLIHVGLRFQ